MNRKLPASIAAAALVAGAGLVGWSGFRSTDCTSEYLGACRTDRSFWRIVSAEIDRNRDGRVDTRLSFSPPARSLDENPDSLLDQDFDGTFELRITNFLRPGFTIEIDDNRDGKFDRVLRDSEADAFRRSVIDPRNREIFGLSH